ncbi:Uncharacterised protein [Achromobacter sp. 2789STDY5608615]|nr:Uncharacterised protein [Achromobacter sp. 2789STDY5608615]
MRAGDALVERHVRGAERGFGQRQVAGALVPFRRDHGLGQPGQELRRGLFLVLRTAIQRPQGRAAHERLAAGLGGLVVVRQRRHAEGQRLGVQELAERAGVAGQHRALALGEQLVGAVVGGVRHEQQRTLPADHQRDVAHVERVELHRRRRALLGDRVQAVVVAGVQLVVHRRQVFQVDRDLVAGGVGTVEVGHVAQLQQLGLQAGPGAGGLVGIEAGFLVGGGVVEHHRHFGHPREGQQAALAVADEAAGGRHEPVQVLDRILGQQFVHRQDGLVFGHDFRRVVVVQLHQVGGLLGLDRGGGFLLQLRLRGEGAQGHFDLVLLLVVLLGQLFEFGLVGVRQRVPDLDFDGRGMDRAHDRHGGAKDPCAPAGEHRAGNARQLQFLHRFIDQEKGIPVLDDVRSAGRPVPGPSRRPSSSREYRVRY